MYWMENTTQQTGTHHSRRNCYLYRTIRFLKRFKDDVKEVTAGYECGLNIVDSTMLKSEILSKDLRGRSKKINYPFLLSAALITLQAFRKYISISFLPAE